MTSIVPKAILWILVAVTILLLTIGLFERSISLEVHYQNNLLKIQNIGDAPVEIQSITLNDRKDCSVINLIPTGKTLGIGDTQILMTTCDVVRATIATSDGTDTYYFSR